MTIRSKLHSTFIGLFRSQSKRSRNRIKKARSARFFEQLENRLVLNGLPITKPDYYATDVDAALTINGGTSLLLNDWDPESSSLTASIVATSSHGTISSFSSGAGTLVYTPDSSWSGIDSFTYKTNDGSADGNTVTVSIAVGGNFGPRTNIEEEPRYDGEAPLSTALPSGCTTKMDPVRLTASCLTGDLLMAQTLTPGVDLIYNSGTLPKPIIVLETSLASFSDVPDEIKARLTFNGSNGTTYSYDTEGLEAGNAFRIALQADATGLATGRYAYTVRLTATFDSTDYHREYAGYTLVVNRSSGSYPFGRGFQLADLDQLFPVSGGVIFVQSSGNAFWFAENGGGTYKKAPGDDSFSTLVLSDGTYTLTDKHGMVATFSSTGLLATRVDRNDNTWTYTHEDGLLVQMTDPYDRDIDFDYTDDRLTMVTDFAGRSATLTYDSGDLATVTQPDPGESDTPVWEFGYDETSHLLTELTNPLEDTTEFVFGDHHRLLSIDHSETGTWELTALQTIGLPPDTSGNELVAANPLGIVTDERTNEWTFRTDRFGGITQWVNPLGHTTLVDRTVDGLPSKLTEADPDGGGGPLASPITRFGRDALGNLRYLKNPDNSTRTWTYSETFNLPLTATDELSRTTEYTYDSDGNLTEIEDGADLATTFTFEANGLLESMTTPDPDAGGGLTAAETIYEYDEFGRLETVIYEDATTKVYTYDDADNITSEEDELANVATIVWDDLGRLVSATDRELAETVYTYNALGLLIQVTDALGNDTDYVYTTRNFLESVTQPDPDGGGALGRPESTYGYDGVGNMITVGEHTYTGVPVEILYDDANRRTRYRKEVSSVEFDTYYSYDNLGRLTQVTDALLHDTYLEYSSRGWLTKTTGEDPDAGGPQVGPITQYTYDVAGQRTGVTDPRGYASSFTFDSRGLMITSADPDPDGSGSAWTPTTYYGYDNVGRLKTVDDPDCRVTTIAYDSRDRMTSITLPDPDGAGGLSSPVWSFGYDDAGRQTSITDPLSHVTAYTFDDVGRVLTVTDPDPDAGGGQSSPVTTYVYDDMGNVSSVTDPRSKVTTYVYDDLQRLITLTQADPDGGGALTSPVTSYFYNSQTLLSKITDPLAHDTTITYDGLGRRTGVTDHQSHQTTLTYNKVDLVTSVTLPDPDAGGELTAPVTEYGYDVYNRLTSISDPLEGVTYFTYDKADNLLTVEDPENNVTSYAYDGMGRLTIETNELEDSRSYYYDPASNLARRVDRNGRVIQFVRDELDRITEEEWYSDGSPAPSLSVATTTEGGPTNEVQRVGFTVGGMITGGTFTLTYGANTTSGISYNASAATVQTALEGLGSIGSGNVSVTQTQNSASAKEWRLTFQGSMAGTNASQTTINSSSVTYMGGSKTDIQATDTQGATNNEVQTVTLSNTDGGVFRLAFLGEITPPLDYDASSGEIDTALENLSTVDTVTVSGSNGGPWTVTFTGAHANLNVAKINGDAVNLTGGSLERTITYEYDAANRLTSAFDPDSGYDYTYDNMDRLLTVDNDDTPDMPHVILTSAYDAASNRTSLSVEIDSTDDFQNTYTHDALNRLTRVDQIGQGGGNEVAEKRVDFSYNKVGQFTEIARFKDSDAGGSNEVATSTYTYDSINRLTGLAYKKNSSNLFTPYSWTFDHLSRPTQFTSQDGTTDYMYDAFSRLTGADHSYQTDESYSYDANGNRTMEGYEIGPNNQLLDDGTYTYEYDGEGNRIRREKTSDNSSTEYEWDFRSRLLRVTEKDEVEDVIQVVEYSYDIFDQRIAQAVDSESPFDMDDALIERYVLDGGNVVLDFVDPDGSEGEDELALARRYLFGNAVDQILAQEDVTKDISATDRTLWPLVDNLQSVRNIGQQNGSIAEHYTYDSYGTLISGDTSLSRYFFMSNERDEHTEAYYINGSWYDSTTGSRVDEPAHSFDAGYPQMPLPPKDTSVPPSMPQSTPQNVQANHPSGYPYPSGPKWVLFMANGQQKTGIPITIYVNMNQAPTTFNIKTIQAQINLIMKTNGLGHIPVTLVQTTKTHENLPLGFQTVGIINKDNTAYHHYVGWKTTVNGKYVAQNAQGDPFLHFDNTGIKHLVQGERGVVYTEYFSNCIVHEMFFHGVLKQSDMDVDKGEFESSFAKRNGMVKVGPKWVKIIDSKMQP